jgi:hypothetical protein
MKNKKRNERRSNEREKEGVRKRGGEDSDRRRSKKMYAAEPWRRRMTGQGGKAKHSRFDVPSRALDADEHFSLLSLFRYGPNEPIPVS